MDLSIEHFKNLWSGAIKDFDSHCKTWECVCEEDNIPEDVLGEIRTVIGLAKLLKGQKLKQFRGLIDNSEFKTGEKEITLIDLQGFWDMVYCEVEKIQKSFKRLEDCRNNEWKFIEENVEKVQKKKVVKTAPLKKVNSAISHAEAARQRLAEIKKKMKALQQKENVPQNSVEIGNVLVLESKSQINHKTESVKDKKSDAPSPSKIAKKQSLNEDKENRSSRKTPKNKSSPKKKTKSMADKISVQKGTKLKQDKNIPVNIQVLEAEKAEVFKRRIITRSVKKAILAEQEAAKTS